MSGRMRKREKGKAQLYQSNLLKGFHPPQKDNSRRQKKKARLNNHKQDKED